MNAHQLWKKISDTQSTDIYYRLAKYRRASFWQHGKCCSKGLWNFDEGLFSLLVFEKQRIHLLCTLNTGTFAQSEREYRKE